jgi:hypothetical protein
MRVDKYTMAQSWMRQDDATPEEAKATWDTLETEFEDKRKAQLMASAETDEIIKTINDKFGPGTMFPASEAPIPPMTDQQAIFEFGQRNPQADGGRIGFEKGLKVEGKFPKKEGFVWDRKAKVFRKSIKGKKGKNFEQWLLDQIEADNTEFKTAQDVFEAAGEKSHGSNQKIWNKYKDKFKITSGSRLGGNIALKNEKILEFFNKQEPGSKINVERAVKEINKNLPKDQQISESIITNRLKDKKFNTNFLDSQTLGQYHGELSDAMKHNIIAKFGDDLGITMEDFEKKGKYGVNATEVGSNKYQAIRNAVSDKNTPWNRAYNLGAADGWLLESYGRAGYKPLTEMIGDRERIVGYEAPDGTKWFGGKKWADKYNGKHVKTTHPGYDRVNKLVTVVSETRVAPNDAIIDMLKKGSGVKNIDGITLESLTNYLLDNDVDVKNIKKGLSTYHKHHVKGVKIVPDDDIQLVTRVANTEARKVMNEVEALKKNNQPIDYDALDNRLKNYGVSVEVDGKRLGGSGFESKADIEKFVTKKIGAWEKADFEKFANQFDNPKLKKFIAQNMLSSGPAGALELFKADPAVRRIANSQGYKTFMKAARMPGKFFGIGDAVFGYFDYKNNLSKGQSHNVALQNAKQAMSFGLWKVGDEEVQKEIRERFVKEGGNPDIFDQTIALNKKTQQFQNRLNEFAEQSEWAGDKAAKSTFEKMLTKDMNDILDMRKQFSTDYAVSEAGAPIQIKDTSQPFTDVKKAAYEYAKEQSGRPDVLEGAAVQRDATAGTMGNLLQNFLSWDFPNILRLKPTQKIREENQLKQLKEQDPVMFEKLLQSKGIYRSEGLNLPALINFSMQYPEYGVSFETEKKANGGIAGVKKVDPDELKEAQEKMKKLMKQYKNKNLDWDAVKRSYKIWTK